MTTSPCHTQAILIGQKAAERLSLPGYRGRVLAVVSSAVYLAGYDGEVLWVGQADLPAHRRCILASFHAENVEAGMEFVTTDTCLCIGSEMTIGPANADRWKPPALEHPPREPMFGRLGEALTAIQPLPRKGLGYALAWMTQPAGRIDYATVSAMDTLLLHRAEPVIRELASACRRRDMKRVVNVGLDLVGLGPGLTPSGDDYLGGLLFSAYHLEAAYALGFDQDGDRLHDFLNKARPLTSPISHTILSDLAHGHGPAPLHDLINLLLQGMTGQPLRDSAQQLTRIGHTSGWDMLAGALTGMLLQDNFES
jgi:hypothetical protein